MSIPQIIGWSIVAALFIGVYVTIAVLDDIWTALLMFGATLGLFIIVTLGVALASGAFG